MGTFISRVSSHHQVMLFYTTLGAEGVREEKYNRYKEMKIEWNLAKVWKGINIKSFRWVFSEVFINFKGAEGKSIKPVTAGDM